MSSLKTGISYIRTKNDLKRQILEKFSSRKEKVNATIGDETFETTEGYILVNLILMQAFRNNSFSLTRDDMFNHQNITQDSLEEYFNKILDKLSFDYDIARESIADIMCEISDLSSELNVLAGHTVSYLDILKIEATPKGEELFHPTVKEGQYNDIEKQFKAHGKKLVNYFKEHPETELHPFITSETGINTKQFQQACGFVGLKPDVDGSIIPVTITDNFVNGLKSLESYYINCKGTRLALLTNNKMTRRSGYLTRKLYLSNIDHYHDNNLKDCGTKHFVIYHIENERKLKLIDGRHYYKIDENGNKISDTLFTVSENDTELIGQTIGLRSPVTCAGGKHVCATCYGKRLSEINKDVNTGLVAVLRLTEPITQKLLSAKHLLSTNSERIEWGEDFSEYFAVNMNTISFVDDSDFSITFDKPTEYDEDQEMYSIEGFTIQTQGKKGIEYKSPVKLFVNEKLLPVEKMKDDDSTITINSKDASNDYLFKFEVKNNEITKSLQQILDLIESNDHLGITDYSEFVNTFDNLLIENDMDYIKSVHIEMISSQLIRNSETLKPLDFSKDVLDDYTIIRVSKSDMLAPLAVSLSFERIPEQLVDLSTYEKEDTSVMDYLFR